MQTVVHVVNLSRELAQVFPSLLPKPPDARIQFGVERLAQLCTAALPKKLNTLTSREWVVFESDPLLGEPNKHSRLGTENFSQVVSVPVFGHLASNVPYDPESWLQAGVQAGAVLVQAALTLPPCELLFVVPLIARRLEPTAGASQVLLVSGLLAARFMP